jgi:phosphatidyl-myo-inositol alpha-mannosyltransferase
VIPNGISIGRFRGAEPLAQFAGSGETVGFIGRYDEPRKGMQVLIAALGQLAPSRPDLQLLVAGRADAEAFRQALPATVRGRVTVLGQVSEPMKASLLRTVDLYCAPNTGQESFGIILLEAMAAGAPIVASDLEAFRRVLSEGAAGRLFPTGDAKALAVTLDRMLDDPALRSELAAAGTRAVAPFDWSVIVAQVVRVYELAIAGAGNWSMT